MDRIYDVTAGIDVHRDTNVVTVRSQHPGGKDMTETKTFETFHDSIVQMALWLTERGVQVVGLESTGEYWKPVVRVLQQLCASIVIWLVNPTQVKKVPGRKSDVTDSQWLSKLVMFGLVSPSFLPSAQQTDLRALTRLRTKVVADRTRHSNRIIKVIEATGIKLASVCSDVLGKTGRKILNAMVSGVTDPAALAELACGTLRNKKQQLMRAVQVPLSEEAKFVLRELFGQLDATDQLLDRIDARVSQLLKPFVQEVALLKTIDGVDDVVVAVILAECGADMSVFPSQDNLTSWAGFSPGSNQSAGKVKNAPARKGDKYLRTIMVQAAQAAVKTKASFWKQNFARLIVRLGHNKATFATARKMLVAVYHILRDHVPCRDLQVRPPSPVKLGQLVKRYTAHLEELGYAVSLTPRPAPVDADSSVGTPTLVTVS